MFSIRTMDSTQRFLNAQGAHANLASSCVLLFACLKYVSWQTLPEVALSKLQLSKLITGPCGSCGVAHLFRQCLLHSSKNQMTLLSTGYLHLQFAIRRFVQAGLVWHVGMTPSTAQAA